jgi:plastocyanin
MRRIVLALALVFPATASAETATVAMPGKSFSPARVTIVAGDSVLWRNGDLAAHDVKGADFTSGPLASSAFFTHEFDAVGARRGGLAPAPRATTTTRPPCTATARPSPCTGRT